MGGNRKSKIGLGLTGCLLVLSIGLLSWVPWPAEQNAVKQIQDDALAQKYCPGFVQGEGIKPDLSHVYYRMAVDDTRILIACHPVWPYEKDEGKKGFATLFNKLFYTGGLKLQTKIFGPEDIEALELVVDKQSKKIIRIRYESASHDKQEVTGVQAGKIARPWFEVTTWNHMFELVGPESASGKKVQDLKPEYFTDERWNYYGMTKKKQSLLSQDRAHFEWEHQ
jgi:hypothetical protein